MNKLNITFCSFPDFAGNAKALFEYMVKRYKDNMNYTWIVYNKETVQLLKKKNINAILIGTDEFKKYITKTNVFFTTQGNLDGDKEKAKGSIYVELWHGVGPKPIGFAQENPSDEDLKGYQNISEIVDCFIVPSEFWKVVWGAIFKVEKTRIKSLGMPIFDYFKNSDGKSNLSKVLNKSVTKYKKIIMYMPTFRKGFNHDDILNDNNNVFNIKNDYNYEKLNEFLNKNNYLLCIKMHPGELTNISIEESDNISLVLESNMIKYQISVNEIMNAFDLLITDYSSIGTEFLFLNKPILFNTSDIEEYKKNRGLLFGNSDFWFPGPTFNTQKDFIKETKKLLEDSNYYKNERISKKELWFGNLKDGGCKEICDYIFDGNLISSKIKKFVPLRKKYEQIIKEKDDQISYQNKRIEYLMEKEQELAKIKFSRSYKIRKKISNIRKRNINEK